MAETGSTIADLTQITAIAPTDELVIVDVSDTTDSADGTNKKVVYNDILKSLGGWISANETWTYNASDKITVPSGATSRYQKGDWIKITQTTDKYFKIIAVADTLLTVTAGTTHTVANATITAAYYSHQENPLGVPTYFAWTPVWSLTGGTLTTTYTTQLGKFTIHNGMIDFWWNMTLNAVSTATPTKAFQVNCPISTTYMEGNTSVGTTGVLGTARFYDDSGGLQNAGWMYYYNTDIFRMIGETQDIGSASVGVNPNITLANGDRWGGHISLPLA